LVLFFRMPPIVFSLVIFRLPEAVEYALYAPTVMIAGAALLLAVAIGLRTRFWEAVGKDYDREVHGGPEGPCGSSRRDGGSWSRDESSGSRCRARRSTPAIAPSYSPRLTT